MDENLALLADKLGIARYFADSGMKKQEYEVNEDIVKFFCNRYGYKTGSEAEIQDSLRKFDERGWKKTLENILIVPRGNLQFTAALTTEQLDSEIKLEASRQSEGYKFLLPFTYEVSDTEKKIGRKIYRRVTFSVSQDLEFGYYDLFLTCGQEQFKSVLAVTPEKCYRNEAIESGKLWGYSLQLYSLKSRHNWGVGDFTDLKNFVQMCARAGADVIGLNPLNVLFHDFPENASPYSSISRMFLNPIYIDVEKIPGFCELIREKYSAQIADAKQGDMIDYTKVYTLKIKVLQELFGGIHTYPEYQKEFTQFKQEKDWELDMLATYQALYEEQSKTVYGGWCAWDKELQNSNSLAVAQFKQSHQNEIEFFKFLQFAAARQLHEVHQEVQNCGLKLGLYRDLPVGVCKDSAELWADRYVFIDKAGAGAPPDAFFPAGQRWCLGAFNPFELKERAYEPYLKILRANMACAGALRIDHVMGMMRLFMIPDDKCAGTYIHYNFDEMLHLLALESHLHQCVVVGESIGNVPTGFLDKLRTYGIYAISVLWSERWNAGYGDFKMPRDFPQNAFVSVGTHDMPPLKMWWFGYEIEVMHRLNMITDADMHEAYKRREADRRMLLAALDFNNTWPEDKKRQGDYLYGENYPEGIDEAVHCLLARSESKVVMIQPEDVLHVDRLQNLPGTDRDKYPNWRSRLPIDLEDWETLDNYCRNVAMMQKAR